MRAENAPAHRKPNRQIQHVPRFLDDVGKRTIAGRVDARANAVEQQRRARAVAVREVGQAAIQDIWRLADHAARLVRRARSCVRRRGECGFRITVTLAKPSKRSRTGAMKARFFRASISAP